MISLINGAVCKMKGKGKNMIHYNFSEPKQENPDFRNKKESFIQRLVWIKWLSKVFLINNHLITIKGPGEKKRRMDEAALRALFIIS